MTPLLDVPRQDRAGDGAFPQVRKLSLVELGTHVEVAMLVKHLCCGERTMVEAFLRHLSADALFWTKGFSATSCGGSRNRRE